MADISKIKLANGTTADIKDATARAGVTAAQTSISEEVTRATGAEATLQTNINTEASTRAAADSALDTRVTNLEARGRFLSNYNAETGLPTTYPTVPSGQTSYTYTFKSGDYYIVGSVPTSGTVYMPSGSSISTADGGTTWTVGKVATTDHVSVGDQYVFDGTNWVHIAAAKDVSWGEIVGDLEDQTDLQAALDDKVPEERKVAGINLEDDITVAEMQTALGLEDLAYADTASGSYTPAGTIGEIDVTAAGTITVNDLTQTATAATLTKGDFTPAGSITGSAISGGSIDVTVKDASAASEATLTRADYTPEGTVAVTLENNAIEEITSVGTLPTYEAGSFSGGKATVVDTTKFDGGSAATWTGNSYSAPSFTEGSFTAASYDDGFLSAGAQASFTQGAKASLTAQSTSKFAAKMPKAVVGTGDDAETLMFDYVDSTDTTIGSNFSDAVTDRGTFTANGDDSFTANTLQSLDSAKFHGGSKAADTWSAGSLNWGTFNGGEAASLGTGFVTAGTDANYVAPTYTAGTLPTKATKTVGVASTGFTGTKSTGLKVTKAEYLKQEIDTKTFTPTAATLGFSGTKAENVLVTGVSYDKATANGATFAGTTKKVTPTFTGTAATITVTPDEE